MIELCSVFANAGKFRLEDINLTINSGGCHVIVGQTGAGKTCLLETILGLREHASGKILIDGNDVSAFPPHQRNISYVPQDICLFPNMNVIENIHYGSKIRNRAKDSDQLFVDRLIDFLHLRPLLLRYPQNLSGGEKQRVALVRALAIKPLLLVLDEPFSALDHSMREGIRRTIKELLEEFKTTTLIVTHDLDEAYFLGDQISILQNGRIIQTGRREEIYYYPKSLAAASFIGIKNIFRGKISEIFEEKVFVSCEALNKTIAVGCKCGRKKFAPGQEILFGIHSEAVYILRPGNDQLGKDYVFDAVVKKMYIRGKMHTLLVELDVPQKTIVEIDIHDAAVRKIGIENNAKIQISLNPAYIFLLPASPPPI